MRKFKTNSDKKKLEPTSEQIARQKDFSRLHHKYETLTKRGTKPLYRNKKKWLLLVIIGIVLLILFWDEVFG